MLLNATDNLTALLEYLPDFVLRFDRSLRCTYANPTVERTCGLDRDELLGRVVGDLGLSDGQSRVWTGALRRVFASATPETLEAQVTFADSEWRCQAVLLPQPLNGDGFVDSVLIVAHNLGKNPRLAREYTEFTTQLREHERRLREFIERAVVRARQATEETGKEHNHDLLLNLTLHERELLRLLAAGKSNAEIGRQLGLSGGTVRNQLTRLYLKLGVADRTHAAARAVALRLVPVEP